MEHEEGLFTLEECENCFWKKVPMCPRKEWDEKVIQKCDFMLKAMSQDEGIGGFNIDE